MPKKILMLHNKYKEQGGEDVIFELERDLLSRNGHEVETILFDNAETDFIGKKKLAADTLYNKDAYKKVRKIISAFKPELLHVHNIFYRASPSVFFAAQGMGIPSVITLHNFRTICNNALMLRDGKPCEICIHQKFPLGGIKFKCFQNSTAKSLLLTTAMAYHKYKNTWNKQVSAFIALSDFSRNKFMHSSLKLEADKVFIKPNSVDDTGFENNGAREDFFLYVGRLSTEKGIDTLLKATPQSPWRIEIAGSGPLLSQAKTTACAYPDKLKLLGFMPRHKIIEKLKKCRALIFPSVCYENLPTSILEAFSTGTPIIISDQQNLRDIVHHNKSGMHFSTADPVSLAKTLHLFKNNLESMEHLYKGARNEFEQHYTHQKNYKRLLEIYQSAAYNFSKNKTQH